MENELQIGRLVNYLFAKKLMIWKCIITKRQMASKEGAHCTLNETQIVLISRICSWRTNFIANGKDLLNWIELFSHITLLFTNALLLTIFYCDHLSPSFWTNNLERNVCLTAFNFCLKIEKLQHLLLDQWSENIII